MEQSLPDSGVGALPAPSHAPVCVPAPAVDLSCSFAFFFHIFLHIQNNFAHMTDGAARFRSSAAFVAPPSAEAVAEATGDVGAQSQLGVNSCAFRGTHLELAAITNNCLTGTRAKFNIFLALLFTLCQALVTHSTPPFPTSLSLFLLPTLHSILLCFRFRIHSMFCLFSYGADAFFSLCC